MSVETVIEDPRWAALDLERLARRATAAVLTRFDLDAEAHEIAVMGCDDARIAELNGDFRAKEQATNVLSWPARERGAAQEGATPDLPPTRPDPQDAELGDIAISYDTCAREARAQGRDMQAHCTHLLVHGTLHLLGFDHQRDGDATVMEGLETEILGNLGIEDPYRTD